MGDLPRRTDLVDLPLTADQLRRVLNGDIIAVDVPDDGDGPRLQVIVRLKRELPELRSPEQPPIGT